mgnify:CR=1 FL=1
MEILGDLPAAGGNFANFEVKITENEVKSGNFRPAALSLTKISLIFIVLGGKIAPKALTFCGWKF